MKLQCKLDKGHFFLATKMGITYMAAPIQIQESKNRYLKEKVEILSIVVPKMSESSHSRLC